MSWRPMGVHGRGASMHTRDGGFTMQLLRGRLLYVARLVLTLVCAATLANAANAVEIKLLSSGGMRVALIDLISSFERTTKYKVAAIYGAPGAIRDRILAGEPLDVLVFPEGGVDALAKQSRIVSGSK